jgi:hypothetical protein
MMQACHETVLSQLEEFQDPRLPTVRKLVESDGYTPVAYGEAVVLRDPAETTCLKIYQNRPPYGQERISAYAELTNRASTLSASGELPNVSIVPVSNIGVIDGFPFTENPFISAPNISHLSLGEQLPLFPRLKCLSERLNTLLNTNVIGLVDYNVCLMPNSELIITDLCALIRAVEIATF